MKKYIMDGDSIILDGVEITKEELKKYLTERIVLKRQLNYVKELAAGGVSSE